MRDAAVLKRLDDGEVGVVQLDVLADQRDGHFALRVLEALDQLDPVLQVGLALLELERLTDLVGEALALEHQRHLIQRLCVEVLDDVLRRHVAELRQLSPHVVRHGIVAAADEHVRLDAHGLQRLDRVLRRLGLELLAALEVGDQRDVDEQHFVAVDFPLELADGLDERLALDVADRAADLSDDDVALLADAVELFLDFVGHVRDDLHGAAVVAAAALAVEHGEVHLPGRDGRPARQVFVDEALVVAEVEVGLHAVLGDEHLAVLVGVHRAGIDVEIRVELLNRHRIAARLEQPAQRRRGDPLAERRRDAARDENVLRSHANHPSVSCVFPWVKMNPSGAKDSPAKLR